MITTYKEIVQKIIKDLNYNKNPKDGCKPITTNVLEITKGMFGKGSTAIKNKVCDMMEIKPWNAPFTMVVQAENDIFKIKIEYK